MRRVIQVAVNWELWKDRKGQDLIEFALMAGFVVVAAGALLPGVADGVGTVLSKVSSVMVDVASDPLSRTV